MCHTIDWQPLVNALAGGLVLASPGVAALLVALSNRGQLKNVAKRSTDPPNGGQNGGGQGVH